MPRPPLTKDRVVSAGVLLVRELGLEALDYRAVARRVHSSPTAVQRVVSPTELRHEVFGQILSELPRLPARGHWSTRLRRWAKAVHAWGLSAPGIATYALGRRWDEPSCLDAVEDLTGLLVGEGLEGREAVQLSSWLLCFIFIRTDLDQPWRAIGRERSFEEIRRDRARWPELSAHLREHDLSIEGLFGLGLDLVIGYAERQLRLLRVR
jgi:hypothetical protein